ncbi:MAG: hypothetical protein FWF87_00815 [Synergistaceae bacterium]|nr:hypothetical protein [Synergistaceae bacterium]
MPDSDDIVNKPDNRQIKVSNTVVLTTYAERVDTVGDAALGVPCPIAMISAINQITGKSRF